ncbi:MAG TPA: RnfH family protein [Nitrosospira sp.]|nr:RnfH family protein [Nitrosospira sp.]
MNRHIEIEVVYALPEKQVMHKVRVPDGTTAEQAVRLSGILEIFPEIDLSFNKIGIFGKVVKPGRVLRDSDRVEIYRALAVDPKEARRRRAAAR